MAKKPRKNGKAKRIQKQQLQVREMMKTHCVAFAYDPDNYHLRIYSNDGHEVGFEKTVPQAIEMTPLKWTYICYVLMRDNQGNNYMKSFTASAPFPCKRSQIRDNVAEAHKAFMDKDCNPNHILTAGWIATTEGHEPSDDVAYKIFDNLGVWDFTAPFEGE
ncbi:hypothetical protein NVP1013O_36 [Vibrio phage 1.013.O._10N.286.54.F9]|nr:hypothetical protein NVP1013O_36 [Vibrio phage 1.013.O._10N.286.54.F9]